MKRWWLVIALLLSLGVNAGILATLAVSGRDDGTASERASGRPGPRGGGLLERRAGAERPALSEPAEGRLVRLVDDLGLSGPERERFLELQRTLLLDGARLARERFRLQAELRRELLADEPDRVRIGELIGEIAAAFTRLEEATAEAILDSRELLDPEQERRYLEVASRIRPRLLRQADQSERGRFGERRFRERPVGPPAPVAP